MARKYFFALSVFLIVLLLLPFGLCADKPQSIPEQIILDNGVIELHLDTQDYGGSITYLAPAGTGGNLINNYDMGRQIQQSYYAGQDRDRLKQGQHPSWYPWPWNPTQSGDAYGHPSRVVKATQNDTQAYVKTIPNLWDMEDKPCACVMQTWVRLEDNRVMVRNRLSIQPEAPDWEPAPRHQEMPAVYTRASLSRIMTYVGDEPWTKASLTRITKKPIPDREDFPWNYWPSEQYPGQATEKWAAAVNEQGFGLGVFMPEAEKFIGGTAGQPKHEQPQSFSTTYIAPLRTMTLQPGDEVEYTYVLILDQLEDIRSYVYSRMDKDE